MKPGELRAGVNVADELARDRLVHRVRAAERSIQRLLNTTAYYNRVHPDRPPIAYDDDGLLEGSCNLLGLDWAAMVAKAEGHQPPACTSCGAPVTWVSMSTEPQPTLCNRCFVAGL